MSERPIIHTTLEEFQGVSQTWLLSCQQCGDRFDYDVGAICCDEPGEGKSEKLFHTFCAYFRCRKCGGAGPWDVVDHWKWLGLAARALALGKSESYRIARCVMFDGTLFQTPAMGEEHLLSLIQKDPGNAFLYTRLGNLFRNCGLDARAGEWFAKAVRLDPNDVEARHSLFIYAAKTSNMDDAHDHAMELVRSLLDGYVTQKDELTKGIALSLIEHLRDAPLSVRERILETQAGRTASKEEIFTRALLAEEGNEETIVNGAAERLLAGEFEPLFEDDAYVLSDEGDTLPSEAVPSLQALVAANGLNPRALGVAFQTDEQGNVWPIQKHSIPVTDGAKIVTWEVPALTELFRGHAIPPKDIDHYPPEYTPHFFFIENHFLTFCHRSKDRTDQEMEEVYAALRRRPDGRSVGMAHDFMWQVAALLLGSRVVSAAEYDALFGALGRSARKWSLRPVSRNYIAYLRKTFA